MPDMILNGAASGDIATRLLACNMDARVLRPFIHNGAVYIDATGPDGKPTCILTNAQGTLRKDEWIRLDEAVQGVAKPRLSFVNDFRSRGLVVNIPNGMGTTVFQHQKMSDITRATISMNGLRKSESDRPVYDLHNLPLPIIHKDFSFDARDIATARQSGRGIDVSTAELATRRVVEEAEILALGMYGTYQFGGGNIYGVTNFPDRQTHDMTLPDASGWTGKTLISEILAMKQKSMDEFQYGPWMLYTSPAWDQYLDSDYSDDKGDNTVRERIAKINGIAGVKTVDYLNNYQMILVQLTSDVFRMVVGMDVTTVQWETSGGLEQHFKVMAIMVPQPRCDINGKCGIVHGVAS